MSFPNATLILKRTTGLSSFKLLILTAQASRPRLRMAWDFMLKPFVRDNQVPLTCRESDRTLQVSVRLADRSGDLHSVLEVLIRKVYALDPAYVADLVIDGGANVGLFTLQAAAVYPNARIIACEPLPRNIEQLEKHLSLNHVTADVLPVCLGGARRTISFYCREAHASSFDAATPYNQILSIGVMTLEDVMNMQAAEKVLIKLDIEGMEIEVLEEFVPKEKGCVVVVGELHGHRKNCGKLQDLFAEHGWSFRLGNDLSGYDAMFEARSPAASAPLTRVLEPDPADL